MSPSTEDQPSNPAQNQHLMQDLVRSSESSQRTDPLGQEPCPTPLLNQSQSREWQSWKLKWWWMTILLCMEITMIIAIIILERISSRRNGITSVQSTTSDSFGTVPNAIWGRGLLWTTLPSLIMTLYRLAWDSAVCAAADRRPYVELRKPLDKASNVGITVMLDYRSYPSLYSWIIAFRNKHFDIAAAMVLNSVFLLAVIPLSAYLFSPQKTNLESLITLRRLSVFNENSFNSSTDLQPALGIASATRINGGIPPQWMTNEFAFEPYSLTAIPVASNISMDTIAYSAYVSCQAIRPSEYVATYSERRVKVEWTDRGCRISRSMELNNGTEKYANTWALSSCRSSDIKDHYSRFGLLAGAYSATPRLNPFSVISCIPSYWRTYGSLTVLIRPDFVAQFVNFDQWNSSEFQPAFALPYERIVPSYTSFDPSATFSTDAFGRVVYERAATKNQTPFEPADLKISTEEVFATMFAALAATKLFENSSNEKDVQGVRSTTVTRLFVVKPVAYTIIVVLALMILCNVWLFMHVQRTTSILVEEPVGLFGAATLLNRSDVVQFVEGCRTKHPERFDMHGFVKNDCTWESSKCYFDDQSRTIRMVGLKEKGTLESDGSVCPIQSVARSQL